ncbi:MAG: DUF3179 domain-containing protein [Candidatus Doudnabacteria bacterium]|nr:DUF3179 domain-containing protein [Candidatus Doudnabacteria bacterium]
MSLRLRIQLFVYLILIIALGLVWYFYAHVGAPEVMVPAGAQVVVPTSTVPAADVVSITDSGLPAGGVTTLQNLQFTTVSAVAKGLYAEGSGIAVQVSGQARFYPYQILRLHEVAEDTLGSTSLAITYCALCNVAVVYDRSVNGAVAHLRVSGKLSGLDSLLEDVDTGTLWSQVTGKAVRGPLAGLSLGVVESKIMTLEAFANQYPYGQVLALPEGPQYEALAYGDAAVRSDAEAYLKQQRLEHPKTTVVGILLDGQAYALKAETFGQTSRVVVLGTRRVTITPMQGGGFVAEAQAERVPVFVVPWFLWEVYYPETKLVNITT